MNWFMKKQLLFLSLTLFLSTQNIESKSLQEIDEIKEAVDTGTYTPKDGFQNEEAEEAQSNELDEIKEAIDTGTYTPKDASLVNADTNEELGLILEGLGKEEAEEEHPNDDFEKIDEDNWLPPETAITEEIDKINTDNGVKNVIDGDILPPPLTTSENKDGNDKRNALRNRRYIWRSREVPFYFDPELNSDARTAITKAMAEISTKSCIKFKSVGIQSTEHFVHFKALSGCYSYVGKISGKSQDISIGTNCEHKGIAIHELMHALGFFHEQSRYDRDKFVKIIYSNILPGRERNFDIKKIEQVSGLGLPYDYDGIMHYGAKAFAIDASKPTIIKLKNQGGSIGQRNGLSNTDVEQLKTLYDCKTDSDTNSWSSWSSWSECISLNKGRREYSQRFCFRENLAGCSGASTDGTQWRDRACGSGPVVPSKQPPVGPVTNSPQSTPSITNSNGGINEAICGTRSNILSHPGLEPQNIVGGTVVQPGDWPWQVGFARVGSTFIYCGGTLISNEWIISAAHCFEKSTDPSRITARIGEHDRSTNEGREEVITLAKIINHPGYNSRTLENDISLLKLSRPVKYTKYIRPACLPETSTTIYEGQQSFVSGWGTTSEGGSTSTVLRMAKVPIVGESTCKSSLSGIRPVMICAGFAEGGIDSCQGDSGGPLVYQNNQDRKFYLAGVVSWGIGCARPRKYGVYARVTALRAWIDSVLPKAPTQMPLVTKVPAQAIIVMLTCAFESNLCNWQQAKNDNFDWTRRKGATPSSSTGPKTSATGLNDYYVYIETSYPRRNGQIATLRSPVVASNSPTCLSFKANMYGSNVNNLQVSSISKPSGRKQVLYTKSGNQGQAWFDVEVNLPVGEEFQVEISASRGRSYKGDIAIDQIRVLPRQCGGAPMPVTTMKPLAPTPVLLTCAFESNICNWQQAKNDNFDWTRRKGATPSSRTGPEMSATGLNDYYVYIETSYPRRNGQIATLRSPVVASNSPTCLSFKANMYGSNVNNLKVSSISKPSGRKQILYTKSGDQGQAWFDVEMNLPVGEKFQVEISASRGKGYKGDIAIDQIRVLSRQCGGGPIPVTTMKPVTAAPGGCGVPQITNLRVIAGINARPGSWPWQILMLRNNIPMCGGTLINPNTVVTAAHCVSGYESSASIFSVRVGEYDTRITEGNEDTIKVLKIESHPKYSRRTIDYDIAIMKLSRNAKLGAYVGTACLPNANEEPNAGTECYITGFGKIKHPGNMHHTLQQARIKVRSQSDCQNVNGNRYRLKITSRMICAGNGQSTQQSGCHGDSGGPFVCQKAGKWYLHGAVSWGDSTCSAARGYTVFAKTSNPEINSWIRSKA